MGVGKTKNKERKKLLAAAGGGGVGKKILSAPLSTSAEKILVLLFALVERYGVSRRRDFSQSMHKNNITFAQ